MTTKRLKWGGGYQLKGGAPRNSLGTTLRHAVKTTKLILYGMSTENIHILLICDNNQQYVVCCELMAVSMERQTMRRRLHITTQHCQDLTKRLSHTQTKHNVSPRNLYSH